MLCAQDGPEFSLSTHALPRVARSAGRQKVGDLVGAPAAQRDPVIGCQRSQTPAIGARMSISVKQPPPLGEAPRSDTAPDHTSAYLLVIVLPLSIPLAPLPGGLECSRPVRQVPAPCALGFLPSVLRALPPCATKLDNSTPVAVDPGSSSAVVAAVTLGRVRPRQPRTAVAAQPRLMVGNFATGLQGARVDPRLGRGPTRQDAECPDETAGVPRVPAFVQRRMPEQAAEPGQLSTCAAFRKDSSMVASARSARKPDWNGYAVEWSRCSFERERACLAGCPTPVPRGGRPSHDR